MYGNNQNQYNQQQYPQNQQGYPNQQGNPQGNNYQQPQNQYGNQQYNQPQYNQGVQSQEITSGGGPYFQYNEHPDSKANKKNRKSSSSDEENLGYFQQDSQNENSGLSSDKFLRSGFVTKVYTILSAQMAATSIMCAYSMSSLSFKNFQMNNPGLMIAALILNIICLLVLICSRDQARKVPTNYIILAIFTLSPLLFWNQTVKSMLLNLKMLGTGPRRKSKETLGRNGSNMPKMLALMLPIYP